MFSFCFSDDLTVTNVKRYRIFINILIILWLTIDYFVLCTYHALVNGTQVSCMVSRKSRTEGFLKNIQVFFSRFMKVDCKCCNFIGYSTRYRSIPRQIASSETIIFLEIYFKKNC